MDVLGGEIKTVTAFTPRAISGEVAEYGEVIDRKGFESAVFTMSAGNYTSNPTAIDVSCQLQESDDGLTSFGAVTDSVVRVSGEVTTVRRQTQEMNVDLRPIKRYIRLAVTADFTGGTSPTLFFGSTCALGEPSIKPAT